MSCMSELTAITLTLNMQSDSIPSDEQSGSNAFLIVLDKHASRGSSLTYYSVGRFPGPPGASLCASGLQALPD